MASADPPRPSEGRVDTPWAMGSAERKDPPGYLEALATIDGLVDAHVSAHEGGGSTAEHWINMRTPAYRRLRHDYLHFSSYYGNIANGPQFTNNDPINGRRQRIVQDG